MFNWFKTKRIYCIGDVAIPQIYTRYGWQGIDKKGDLYLSLSYQIESCGFSTAQEAEQFLRTINIIYPKGL